MTIEEILQSKEISATEKIAALSEKTVFVPAWKGRGGLEEQYDPKKHPVMNKAKYPDVVNENGITPVTRIILPFQKLAAKRMTELVTGIPPRRIYKPENDKQKTIASVIEAVYTRNRIDSVNCTRFKALFASCEIFTLWYAVKQRNNLYGVPSLLKLRCRTFSPMSCDDLYPLFDEYGDLVAMSIAYQRKKGKNNVRFFDAYTATRHIKWSTENGEWKEVENEDITVIGKIPGVYLSREEPIWEDTSSNVYEMEWSLSRNGNYLRENSKPLFVVFADEIIKYGDEKSPDKEFKSVMQYPGKGRAQYVTWEQAVENLKFYVAELRNLYFTTLQLPDWSYEKMSQVALSGESRKQLFIDAQLKVNDEKGALLESLDRELNVIKAFVKVILGEDYADDVDALKVEIVITAYTITDEKDSTNVLMTANGGKALMSQRESIERYGQSDDVDKTLREIKEEEEFDTFNLTE